MALNYTLSDPSLRPPRALVYLIISSVFDKLEQCCLTETSATSKQGIQFNILDAKVAELVDALD